MYQGFYGLTRTPFAVTPDPAMLFMSKVHREALATIIYGVETRKGFIVCTGEVGTGKSTIIRAFFDQTLADAVKLIYIFTPQVTPLEIAKYICREMQMDDPDSIFAAVPQLQMKLLEMFEAGKTVVLMIDEAQLLPPETLEFLRLLSNFETDTEKLIQIVLVGQPEVDTVLARQDMRQVNQRVALRARLAPLSIEESFEYIDHRIRVCGAGELGQVMSPSAAWLIAEAAGGIPRVINILADNALIAGFGAGQRPLGSHLAGTTVREFLGKSGPAKPAASQRFAPGWRAAMRLRGALAREKDEPEEWVPATPVRNGAVAPARLMPTPPPPPILQRQSAPVTAPALASWQPEPAIAAAPPSILVEPVARPAPRSPARAIPLQEVAPAPPPIAVEPPPPILVEPILVEPIFEPALVDFSTGAPVSIEGLVMVAPLAVASEPEPPPLPPPPLRAPEPVLPVIVASQPRAPESSPRWVKPPPPYERAPTVRPVAPPPTPAPEPVNADGSAGVQPRRRIPPPLPRPYLNGTGPAAPPPQPPPAGQGDHWPALSRVRSGLPPIPRRGWNER